MKIERARAMQVLKQANRALCAAALICAASYPVTDSPAQASLGITNVYAADPMTPQLANELPTHARLTAFSVRRSIGHDIDAGSLYPREPINTQEVAISEAGAINIYLQAPPHSRIGQITGLAQPIGLAVDAANNLYIANHLGGNVLVYAPGSTRPFETLDDSGNYPWGVAVDTDGTVYVSNSQRGSRPAGILVYPKSRTTPSKQLTSNLVDYVGFIAVGPNHSIYLTYVTNDRSYVGVYNHASQPFKPLALNFAIPNSIRIYGSSLLVDDQATRTLSLIPSGQRHPSDVMPFLPRSLPNAFDFVRGRRSLWVTDMANGATEQLSAGTGHLIDYISTGGKTPIDVAAIPQAADQF